MPPASTPSTTSADPPAGIAFVSAAAGHRGPYVALLASMFGLTPVCAPPGPAVIRRLIATPRLLLATIDDNLPSLILTVLCRSLRGRPTVALFLSAHRCFDMSRLKYRLKWLAFAALRRVPHLTLITITPFSVAPRFAEVANFGAHDPQYWDLHNGRELLTPQPTALSEAILQRAAGRRVLCMPGTLTSLKGFVFLSEIMRSDPTLGERLLVVAAGKVQPETDEAARIFVAAGGMLADRLLDDAEMESLYAVSDLIWSCYSPDYDQASGIFGRAVQLGVPVVIRRGALIDRFASNLPVPVVRLDFGHVQRGAEVLAQTPTARLGGVVSSRHADLIGTWRDDFIRCVETGFGVRGSGLR
jgi:hypothetical protein